jgi:glycosyltransferase involved in cell wall biosynthesis
MPPPTVSVVLPTFNRLDLLKPTIGSIRAQISCEWELIIADDGSDAPTREYLARLAEDSRITVLALVHAGRLAPLRNAALRRARGEFIAFMDSDDLWAPDKLARQVAALRASSTGGWSYAAFRHVDERGTVLDDNVASRWIPRRGAVLPDVIRGRVWIYTPTVMVRRSLLEQVGLFDESLEYAEDFELWTRLARASDLVVLDEPLTFIRIHAHKMSQVFSPGPHECRDRVLLRLLTRANRPEECELLRRERAINAASLAAEYAARGRRGEALATLARSLSFSWSHPVWWRRAARALLSYAGTSDSARSNTRAGV